MQELRRRGIPLPERGPWDTDPIYREMCQNVTRIDDIVPCLIILFILLIEEKEEEQKEKILFLRSHKLGIKREI